MTDFGDNQLHPLEIEDARLAAYRGSELQREVEDAMRDAGRKLADAERDYRRKLTTRMLLLHAGGQGLAITTCETVAKGEDDVSELRHLRDIAAAEFKAVQQQAFRRGADRKDVDTLLNWSMKRDLRTDTQPPGYDRQTGELPDGAEHHHDGSGGSLSGAGAGSWRGGGSPVDR